MSKWEEKYEKLKNGEFDARIEELKQKKDNKTSTKEEYKEYEKLLKSKSNLRKVENVLEYRETLKKELKDLVKEIEIRKETFETNKKSEKIEEELNKITEEIIKTEKELKNPKLEEDKRKELRAKREALYGKRDENNYKYVENQKLLEKKLNREGSLKDLSKKEIEDKGILLITRISKCNMVAKNLLNGASWETINLKLDNWDKDKRYTRKKDNKDIIKRKPENSVSEKPEKKEEMEPKEVDIFANSSFENKSNEFGENDIISDSNAEEYNKNKQLMFEKKHPRLAKIQNWLKKVFKKEDNLLTDGSEKEENKESKENKENKGNKENKESKENLEDKSFREYIRNVAEKGMENVDKEEKETRQEELKKKLAEMRKANREAEAKKFGKDYADKSDYRDSEER